MKESYKNESRKNWHVEQGGFLSEDQLKLGCLMRIADASEKIAASYDAMRRISALKGVITKLKGKK